MDLQTRQETPQFVAFKQFAAEQVASHPNLVRCDCLNPIKALKPQFDLSDPPRRSLLEAWRGYLGVRGSSAFLSHGIRHSLEIIFASFSDRTLALPKDVYPVYRMIAKQVGASYIEYATDSQATPFDLLVADILLITAPHTPTGYDLDEDEIRRLLRWLAANPKRRIIIDRVYDYRNSPSIQPLIDTDQAFVCYSLSKTHLAPLASGFTICPRAYSTKETETEREVESVALLTRYRSFPKELQSRFAYRWAQLLKRFPVELPSLQPPASGYLALVRMNHRELLQQGILAVPGNVYNRDDEYSILSCLHETNEAKEREIVHRCYVTVASNFARGYDKYARNYNKSNLPQSTFPDKFFVLPPDRLEIGLDKATKLLRKTMPGDYPIVLRADFARHELRPNAKRGEYVERNHIRVAGVSNATSQPLQIEDVYADSLALNGFLKSWDTIRPRSMSVLPIASACEARCEFCFSHSSVSEEQRQGRIMVDRLAELCTRSQELGAERLVITGGGEPTLLAHKRLIEIIRIGRKHFPKVVLITNGHTLGYQKPQLRLRTLQEYDEAGLSVLAISRHSHADRENREIMKIDTQTTEVLRTLTQLQTAARLNLSPRLICVLQKKGVSNFSTLRAYLDYAATHGISEICFKELYVAVRRESQYYETEYNQWCAANQVPLSLITDFLAECGSQKVAELPWGAPVYELLWGMKTLRVAAYTEPSVFWERTNGICRSWNLMADGACYANLEVPESRVDLVRDERQLPPG